MNDIHPIYNILNTWEETRGYLHRVFPNGVDTQAGFFALGTDGRIMVRYIPGTESALSRKRMGMFGREIIVEANDVNDTVTFTADDTAN